MVIFADTLDAVYKVASIVAGLAAVGIGLWAVIVYTCQWRTMANQLEATREGNKSQVLFELFRVLDDSRDDRKRVFGFHRDSKGALPHPDSRSKEDSQAIRSVAAGFNIAGLLAFNHIVHQDIVVEEWGATLWKSFEWLANEYKKRHPSAPKPAPTS